MMLYVPKYRGNYCEISFFMNDMIKGKQKYATQGGKALESYQLNPNFFLRQKTG